MTGTRVVPSTPIARSASTDTSRYAIAGALPIVLPHKPEPGAIIGGFLVATNGRMLAVAPAGFYDPPAKAALPIIPAAALPANVTGLTINGQIASEGGTRKKPVTTLHKPLEGSFPPVGEVTNGVVDDDTQWIGVSARLLLDLAASIGSGEMSQVYLGIKVKMIVPPHDPETPEPAKVPVLVANKPIAVLPGADSSVGDSFGILMPVNVGGDEGMTKRFERRRGEFIKAWERHEALAAGREPAPYVEPEPEPAPKITMRPVFGTPAIQAPSPPPVRVDEGKPDAAIALAKKLGIEVVTVSG